MDPAAPSHHPPPPPPVAPPRPPQEPAWARHLVQLDNPHPSPLSGTDDLISRFRLAPLYDTFLRPYLPPAVTAPSHPPPSLDPAPAPASPSPAPPHHLGLKITLGGVKFGGLGGSGTSAGGDSAEGASGAGGGAGAAGGEGKKRKRAKMDKTYEHMVGDVLGRISLPRSSHPPNPSTSLLHLVSNPDPAPCPPLHPLDAQQLRDALTLRAGQLAGFDMGVWEARSGVGGAGGGAGGGGGGHKKKKKRKHDDASGGGGGGGADHKKQRR
ncbi:hypothetical protein DMC30DRAFT_420133 [Rhodotorula diobovata]|uniref:Mediator of RNA polymerase II transcription subunit 19 n=1 Tax=Rhodotorula diobovata TaxID=5288 RepID=A0A5C5FLA6_9BASI|nr:hypothetical protein DMC30DRAFT_420133 [Rhodotorula diobovata]